MKRSRVLQDLRSVLLRNLCSQVAFYISLLVASENDIIMAIVLGGFNESLLLLKGQKHLARIPLRRESLAGVPARNEARVLEREIGRTLLQLGVIQVEMGRSHLEDLGSLCVRELGAIEVELGVEGDFNLRVALVRRALLLFVQGGA